MFCGCDENEMTKEGDDVGGHLDSTWDQSIATEMKHT